MDNVDALITQIFEKEPDAVVLITDNHKIGLLVAKDDWENNVIDAMKKEFRTYKPPRFVERADVPNLGVAVKIDLEYCERLENGEKTI